MKYLRIEELELTWISKTSNVNKTSVQGDIALTNPPCHKKTDQRSNGKSPVCLSNELQNGCSIGGVVKKIKKP